MSDIDELEDMIAVEALRFQRPSRGVSVSHRGHMLEAAERSMLQPKWRRQLRSLKAGKSRRENAR